VLVQNIVVDPQSNSQQFIIQGFRPSATIGQRGILIFVDFTNFHQQKCTDNDYETWSPYDPVDGSSCLLGQTTLYRRRKRNSACFNGQDYEPIVTTTRCPCTRDDFECDYCFETSSINPDMCVLSTSDNCASPSTKPPINCVGTWNLTKGYRTVPGSKCDPNAMGSVASSYLPTVMQCSPITGTKLVPTTKQSTTFATTNQPENTSQKSNGGLLAALAILVISLVVLISAMALFFLIKNKKLSYFRGGKLEKYIVKEDKEVGTALLEDY